MDLRASVAGVVVTIVCFVVVLTRAASAPAPRLARPAVDFEKRNVAADMAANEPGWREEAASSFPEDAWSQSDDFHAREAKHIRALADRMGIRIADILKAVDDDLHARRATATSPDPRGAHAVPCKPRPIYD